MTHVVVTGVSSGIGEGICRVLAGAGMHVFGSVRRAGDADRLAEELGARFTPLVFDVTDEAAIAEAAGVVRARLGGQALAGLVNNAGIAVAGPLAHLPLAAFRQQLEVNVTGQLAVAQAFVPLLTGDGMGKGAPGRIVMITSVAGRNANPFMGPYAASKFALEGLAEAMRREFLALGIDVLVVAPGPVRSRIWEKAEQVDIAPYANTVFARPLGAMKTYAASLGRSGLPAERIGAAVLAALRDPRPRVRTVVTPTPFQTWLLNVLPKRWSDRLIARRLGIPVARPGGGGG